MRWVHGWLLAALVLVAAAPDAVGQERGRREVFTSKGCWNANVANGASRVLFAAYIVDHRRSSIHHIIMRTAPMAAQNTVERDRIETTPIVSTLPVTGSVRTVSVYEPTQVGGLPCDNTWRGFWQVGDNNGVQFCTYAFTPFRRLLCQQVLAP